MCRRFLPTNVVILLAPLAFAALTDSVDAQFVYRTLALTGGPAPGRPGQTFDRFNGLSVGDAGQVAIVGQTGFNQGGIWIADGTGLSLLADSSFTERVFWRDDGQLVRANAAQIVIYDGPSPTTVAAIGDPAPGLPGSNFSFWGQVVFHPNGNMVFTAQLDPPPVPDSIDSLWVYRGGALEVVAVSGEPAPGLGPDYVYSTRRYPVFEFPNYCAGDGGRVAFAAYAEEPGGPFPPPPPPEVGLFTDRAGTVNLLYWEGDAVPGLASGETFQAFGDLQFTQATRLAFGSVLGGPSVDSSNRFALFQETRLGLVMVSRTGEPAANQPAGHVYTGLRDLTLTSTAFSFLGISNAGTQDPQTGVQRVWAGAPSDLADLVSADWLQEPPGGEGDTAILVRLTDNRRGRLVVHTADVVGEACREALWMAGDVRGRRIVGVGDVAAGRTIGSIIRYVLNDRAEVVVHVGFDDETEGVFLATMIGDFDRDADVDDADFASFGDCYAGSARPPASTCPPGVDADFDDDGDVDADDFAAFASSFTGAL